MSKKNIFFVILSLIISSSIFFLDYHKSTRPTDLYHVYLKGETIGYIENKELLEEYINNEQYEIKEKYSVEKVYLPNDLDILKEVTYDDKVSTEKEIYEKIKGISPFTVNGYTITIKGYETVSEEDGSKITLPDKKIYVLDKEVFTKALKNTINVFISEQDYNNFVNKTQPEIKDVGSIIEDIYIKNQITISEGKISAEEKIFTDVDELNRYLLFGTLEKQKEYIVQEGDTIKTIAYKNQLSVSEFLIANTPELTSENNILSEGQKVNLGLINPQFALIEEDHVVEMQEDAYETKVEYDDSMLVGYEKVSQEGVNGQSRITKKIQKQNGDITSVVVTKREIIKASVPKIIVKGNKKVPNIGNVGLWRWPASEPYCITSPFGWRWGKHHNAVDISCSGWGSPIYAANNGTVEVANSSRPWPNGNYIVINHNNGFYSIYAHLEDVYVSEGQTVEMGQVIGTMGHTGNATGTHLHFGIAVGFPDKGGTYYDPMDFY